MTWENITILQPNTKIALKIAQNFLDFAKVVKCHTTLITLD